jgi:hypothetical protein
MSSALTMERGEQLGSNLKHETDRGFDFLPNQNSSLQLLSTPTGVVLSIDGSLRGQRAVRVIDSVEILEQVLDQLISMGRGVIESINNGRTGVLRKIADLIGGSVGRIPVTAPLVLIAALAAGCGDKENSNSNHQGDSGMATISYALSSGSTSSLTPPVEVDGTQDNDGVENIGIIGSNYHRIVARGGDLFVETCPTTDALQCVDSTGSGLQAITGLPSATFECGGVFEDADGNAVLLARVAADGQTYFVPVTYTGATLNVAGSVATTHLSNGVMIGSNTDVRVTTIGGTPFAIWRSNSTTMLRNLHTGADTDISGLDPDDILSSGQPALLDDGTTVVTSFDDGGTFKIATAPGIGDIQDSTAVSILSDTDGDEITGTFPAQFPGAEVITFTDPSTGRRWYSESTSTGSGGDDTGEDAGTDDPIDTDMDGVDDSVDNCIDDHNADQSDLDEDGDGDVCDADKDGDGVDNEEDNCPEDVNADQADADEDGVGDVCDPNNDQSPQQALEAACEFAAEKVTIIEGSCEVTNDGCDDPFVTMQGSCTMDVDMGGQSPMRIQIDGTYQFDLDEGGGFRLDGSYHVIDNGNDWATGDRGIATGVYGTEYGADLMPEKADGYDRVHIYCDEGGIFVDRIVENGPNVRIVNLSAGEFADLIAQTGEVIETNGDLVQTSSDPITNGGNRGGCSTNPNSPKNPLAPILGMLALLWMARMRRRT